MRSCFFTKSKSRMIKTIPLFISNLTSDTVEIFDVLSLTPNGNAVFFNLYFNPVEVIKVFLSNA